FWALLASGQITMRKVDGWPSQFSELLHRDAKTRSALLLQALQGLSAAQHLVGGAGPDRAFGVPRWQRAGGARAIARSRRGGAPAAGGGDQALSALGHGGLSAGSSQVLRRGQERPLRGDRIR